MLDPEHAKYVRDGIPLCSSRCVADYDDRMKLLLDANQGIVNGARVVP